MTHDSFSVKSKWRVFDISSELTARLQVESFGDRFLKEADHVGRELIGIVEVNVVARVVELKNLRLASLEMLIVLHDGVSSLSRAKKVASTIHKGNREVKILQHALFCEEGSVQEAEVHQHLLHDNVLLALSLHHGGIVESCSFLEALSEIL